MGPFYNKTIKILEEEHEQTYSRLSGCSDDTSIEVINSKDGNSVPALNIDNKKIFLHSKYDPVKEAERFNAQIEHEKFDLFIIMGFGFAFHIEELVKKIRKDSIVLIIEKLPAMIREAITHRDLEKLLTDERVKLLLDPGEEEIGQILKGKSSQKITFLTHRGSHQVDPGYYGNMLRLAKSYLSTKEVNIATMSKFEKTWSANIARNILSYISLPGVNIFYDKFKGMPAIVAAAGPSLTSSIDFIKENIDNAVIIAVDTSYKILLKNDIEPHFCITVDPQIINARYFEGCRKTKTILVTDPTVHPSVYRLFSGNIVSTGMAFEMMRWIENITGENGELSYGGSVSTNAYDLARRLGASPVILTGQDLAFTGGHAHAAGSYLDSEVRLRTGRFYNSLMFNRYQLTALPKILVDSILGSKVATNQKMMIFLAWFERQNDSNLINATYDGALIKGVKHIPSSEIKLDGSSKDIFSQIMEIYDIARLSSSKIEENRSSILAKCNEMMKELDFLIPVMERSAALSEELVALMGKKTRDSKVDYILNKLSEADNVIEKRDTLKDMISFTIQRVIHTITEGYEIDEADESLSDHELTAKRSHFLYKGLLEGALFNKKILGKMIILLDS